MKLCAAWLIAVAMALASPSEAQSENNATDRPAVRDELLMGAWHAYQRGDCATALRLFTETAERDPPDASGIAAGKVLGDMYAAGRCVPQDDRRALDFYSRAAASGDALANFNVGVIADRLHDDVRAVAGYRAAAEKGHAQAAATLATRYQYGRGVDRDWAQSVEWYRRAAELHDALGEFGLGYAYAEGLGGLPKDEVQAEHWYRLSAEQGYAPAQANLGWVYSHGRGVAVDRAEAVHWYRRAAEQQIPSAMNSYGFALDQGDGVPRDEAAAIVWYRRAAEYGQPNAMHSLAGHYARGSGVDRDLNEALYWALLADRFYTRDPKRDAVRQFIIALEENMKPEVQEPIRQRVAAFSPKQPPQPDMPSVQRTLADASIRERLRSDQHFRLYSVTFVVALDVDGQVLSLRLLRVTDPAIGETEPLDVVVPATYVDAVRDRLSRKRPTGVEAGKAASFVIYFFFSPAYPATVITDLDAGPADQP